jgi:hypothetical protein
MEVGIGKDQAFNCVDFGCRCNPEKPASNALALSAHSDRKNIPITARITAIRKESVRPLGIMVLAQNECEIWLYALVCVSPKNVEAEL